VKNHNETRTKAMHRVVFVAALAMVLLSGLVGGAFWIAATPQGTAQEPDYDALKETMDLHRTHEKVNLDVNDKLQIPTDPKDGIAYQLRSREIDVSTGEATTTLQGVARFYPPITDSHADKSVTSDNDLAVYSGTSYDIALGASQTGFATYVVVRDENAPTSYEFNFDLPTGFKLSEDGEGGIEVLNSNQEVVGKIEAPWAFDADGEAVDTVYKLSNGMLVQTLNHVGAAYPVVADPEISFGWAVYVRWDLTDDPDEVLDDAEDMLEDIQSVNCVGAPLAGTILAGVFGAVVGSIHCLAAIEAVDEATEALEDIEDELPANASAIPADCTLMIRLMYIGLIPSHVKVEDCGAYSGEYYSI